VKASGDVLYPLEAFPFEGICDLEKETAKINIVKRL
jgi:hypothetical protein